MNSHHRTALVVAALLVACTPSSGGSERQDAALPSAATGRPPPTAAATGAGASTSPASPPPGATPAVVVGLVDGDTLDLDLRGLGEERVRLIGIDTPETKKPDSPVECYGPEASAHLAELVPVGTDVALLRDVEVRDQYGRLLGYLFRASDGLFVNLAMVADGFAEPLSIAPNTTFAGEVSRLVGEARRAGRGLWGACPASAGSSRR